MFMRKLFRIEILNTSEPNPSHTRGIGTRMGPWNVTYIHMYNTFVKNIFYEGEL